jgi:hypothetical protein
MNNVAKALIRKSTHFGVENQRMDPLHRKQCLLLYLKMNLMKGYIEELLLSRPELNDVYSRGSQVLKRRRFCFDKMVTELKK